jgi:prepilin-type N-terminal cleavage/methylation domain-containing protein
MLRLPCNNRGFTLIEVIIAMFLTVVAVLALFSLQPTAWQTATRSDMLGRAAGILHERLTTQEALIMNPCNAVTAGATGPTPVFVSGQATAQPGDVQFNVTTTITNLAANVWRVTVRVAWPGHVGISESLVVTRQQGFRFPAGCPNI